MSLCQMPEAIMFGFALLYPACLLISRVCSQSTTAMAQVWRKFGARFYHTFNRYNKRLVAPSCTNTPLSTISLSSRCNVRRADFGQSF